MAGNTSAGTDSLPRPQGASKKRNSASIENSGLEGDLSTNGQVQPNLSLVQPERQHQRDAVSPVAMAAAASSPAETPAENSDPSTEAPISVSDDESTEPRTSASSPTPEGALFLHNPRMTKACFQAFI